MDSLCGQSVQICGPGIGSKDDFETFVKQHMKGAYLTALGLVGNREDALELSQEAFFRAYKHYDQFNAKGKRYQLIGFEYRRPKFPFIACPVYDDARRERVVFTSAIVKVLEVQAK